MKSILRCSLLVGFIVFLFSCKKEKFTSSPTAFIATSVDTLHFDTVFTTTGSISQFVKIINKNSEGIHISSVRVAGGAASAFKINVDGTPGPSVTNVDVAANDSAYIFVTVTINPNAANLAFIVRDSIEISYNGNKKYVQLDAFGQNAHFFRNRTITGTEVWNNDLPYVILGGITVDVNATLTINKNCRVYMHADAPFIINGTLHVNGESDNTRVIFTGDRLDEPYRDFPASYPGLIFTDASASNTINYAIIKNAYQGIVVVNQSFSAPKLSINETIIDNAYQVGLAGINSTINGRNLLITNCGQNLVLLGGGTYNFTHCTVASYSTSVLPHKQPVVTIEDYYNDPIQGLVINPVFAKFTNCILWGEQNGFVDNEIADTLKATGSSQTTFQNVLWRMKSVPSSITQPAGSNNFNQEPLFDTINVNQKIFSFHLKHASKAVDAGVSAAVTGVTIDLLGRKRPVGTAPDLGCYEDW